jgi:hypothetical protein
MRSFHTSSRIGIGHILLHGLAKIAIATGVRKDEWKAADVYLNPRCELIRVDEEQSH